MRKIMKITKIGLVEILNLAQFSGQSFPTRKNSESLEI